MATAGSIIVELLAKTGSFDTDIERSTKATEKRMRDMQRTIDTAGAAMGLTMAGVATAAVVALNRWIDGLDKLNDVSDATGASIENISALEDIGVRAGNSFESVETALLRFNAALKGTDDDGKAARNLAAIGLNVDELRKLDPAEALRQTAVALAGFADDGDKARLVQELFGKSVREVGPFLKDLAEKGQLVATVTTDGAKQAEAFNKELAVMHKNSTDAGRALAIDLVTAINEAAKAFRESGLIEGFRTLFTGTDRYKADKRLVELTNDLLQAENELSGARAKDKEFGDTSLRTTAAKKRVDAINSEIKATQALRAVTEGTFFTPAGPAKPSVPPVPGKPDKAKGPDPDADFKSYLDNLQKQIQKVNELTVVEKLLDDLRRGSLTATGPQKDTLMALAQQIDDEKLAMSIAKQRQDARNKEYEEADKFLENTRKEAEDVQKHLDSLLGQGPKAQLEAQRAELQFLAAAVEKGKITPEQFDDAATGMLHLNDAVNEGISGMEQFAAAGFDALHSLALGGADANDVFKRLLLSLADMVYQIGVVEPLMAKLKETMKGSGGSSGVLGAIGSALAGAFGDGGSLPSPVYGGGMAYGGNVLPGHSYDVGERGVERFVPRTAGYVLPSSRGSDADGLTVINQTTGRVDKATTVPMGRHEKAILLQEFIGAAAMAMGNQNSPMSQSLTKHFNVRPRRS